ncbi:MAG TPA: peptide deformylase [Syntrophales bacterium]|nr:peptide deformylase [Syntrophales bacterium]
MSDVRVLTLWKDEKINEEEALLLRRLCEDVRVPFDKERKKEIRALVDAFLSMGEAAGLAAPQIGISKKIIIFRNKGFDEKDWSKSEADYELLINPRITQARGEMVTMTEGCLSCPEIQVEVSRYPEIKVKAFDLAGRKINRRYTDYVARVAQHEIDHLEGKLIVDCEGALYVPKQRQEFFVRTIEKIKAVTGNGIFRNI